MTILEAIHKLESIYELKGNIELMIDVDVAYCTTTVPVGDIFIMEHPSEKDTTIVKITD